MASASSPADSSSVTPESIKSTFGMVDYGVFAGFLLSSALIGVFFAWKGRNSTNNKEFLTGNRNLATFPVVMSLAASFMSTNTILGVPAEVYTLGTQYAIHIIPFTVACFLSAYVFMPVFYELNMTSVNEYLLLRFKSNHVRIVGSLGFLFCTLPYMGVVLYGPSLALSSVTPLSVERSVLVVGVICTFYTSIGGIKAVIWTDVLQCILMIFGLLMVVSHGLFDGRGLIEPFKIASQHGRLKIFDLSTDPYRNDTLWAIFFGSLVSWCGCYCISQTEVQRFCSTKSASHARRTLLWNIPPVIVIALLAIWSGIVIFAKYYNCDPISMGIIKRTDQLMPYFVMETMSHLPGLDFFIILPVIFTSTVLGEMCVCLATVSKEMTRLTVKVVSACEMVILCAFIAGLFTACVFSGALSTLSSGFNSLAAITWDDLLKSKFTHISGKASSNVTKIISASYGVVSLALAFVVGNLGTVLQASIAISGSLRGPLFALFCLGLFFPFVNHKGGLAGIVIGISVSMSMAIGTIISPRPKAHLDLYTNNCSAHIYQSYGYREPVSHIYPWDYEPQGVNKFIHLSYFYVTVVGFLITITVGIVVSALTGCNGPKDIDERYLSKYALPVSPSFLSFVSQKSGSANITQSNTASDTPCYTLDTNGNLNVTVVKLSQSVEKKNTSAESNGPAQSTF